MPRKKHPETPEEQARRFEREAALLADAGVLNLTGAETALDAFVRSNAGARDKEGEEAGDTEAPPAPTTTRGRARKPTTS